MTFGILCKPFKYLLVSTTIFVPKIMRFIYDKEVYFFVYIELLLSHDYIHILERNELVSSNKSMFICKIFLPLREQSSRSYDTDASCFLFYVVFDHGSCSDRFSKSYGICKHSNTILLKFTYEKPSIPLLKRKKTFERLFRKTDIIYYLITIEMMKRSNIHLIWTIGKISNF